MQQPLQQKPWIFILAIFALHALGLSAIWLCSTMPLVPGMNEFAYERTVLTMLPAVWLLLAQCVEEWCAVWKLAPEANSTSRQTA